MFDMGMTRNQKYTKVGQTTVISEWSIPRLRNLQLGYTFPRESAFRGYTEKVRVYANAENSFAEYRHSGYTPDVNADT